MLKMYSIQNNKIEIGPTEIPTKYINNVLKKKKKTLFNKTIQYTHFYNIFFFQIIYTIRQIKTIEQKTLLTLIETVA